MYIIIVGLGGIGQNLVYLISKKKDNIAVIDKNPERCKDIAAKYDLLAIVGDSTDRSILEQAGVKSADAILITTSDDATNLMTALVGKEVGVPNIVSVVNQQDHVDMFKRAGVRVQENPDLAVAESLRRVMIRPSIKEYISVASGRAEIFETTITEHSKAAGKQIAKLPLGSDVLIVAIERNGDIVVPKGDIELKVGDRVTIFAASKLVDKTAKLFFSNQDNGVDNTNNGNKANK